MQVANGRIRKGGVTSRDVAEYLDISQSTVSRAFTPGASISPALRDRIYAAAEKVGYRPNLLARGLIAGSSKLIGVILARQTNLLYPELLFELSGRLAEQGYQVLLFPISGSVTVQDAIDRIWSYRVDAVLATGVLSEAEIATFAERGLPLVMFNRSFDMPVSSVVCDFAAGARDLATRLIHAGFQEIGIVSGPRDSFVGGEVERGVRAAVGGTHIALPTVRLEYHYESGAAALAELERLCGHIPKALICVNDTVAAGCLDQLRGPLKLRVPEDVSIVAFGGFGPSRWQGYQITEMRQPMQELTAAAVSMLLERIDDSGRTPERRSLLPIFTPGATTPF